jgi:cell division transport system ATP-binding protein
MIIKFENVSKLYPPAGLALQDLNLVFEPGEIASLVGRSGAGKTTLIKLLIGEEKPTEGQIFFRDYLINKADNETLSLIRQKIGVVFQDYKLLSGKTAYDNVAYILAVIGASDKDIKRDVPRVLNIVNLEGKADYYPYQLSGGEKQRLAIARALIHQPEVIIADEPSGNLDSYNTWDIVEILKRVNKLGTTVIVATHDKEVIRQMDGRIVTLKEGRVVSDSRDSNFVFY